MTVTILILLALSLTMFFTAILLFTSIRKNYRTGQRYRGEIKERIASMRIGEMLKKHNIDSYELLHSGRISDIENKLKTCHECIKTSVCDRILEKPVLAEEELAFCPNHLSFAKQN